MIICFSIVIWIDIKHLHYLEVRADISILEKLVVVVIMVDVNIDIGSSLLDLILVIVVVFVTVDLVVLFELNSNALLIKNEI